jgi:hypothetical protein
MGNERYNRLGSVVTKKSIDSIEVSNPIGSADCIADSSRLIDGR